MKYKLFAFGLVGLAINILFYILFDFYQFYVWDMYLNCGCSYPAFVDSYGDLIVELNTVLIFIFVGFIVGMGLCNIVCNKLYGEKDFETLGGDKK